MASIRFTTGKSSATLPPLPHMVSFERGMALGAWRPIVAAGDNRLRATAASVDVLRFVSTTAIIAALIAVHGAGCAKSLQ
jgi:hypothetical protein